MSDTKVTTMGTGRRAFDILAALLATMRPKQWSKNAFVFVPLVFDRKLFDPTSVVRTLIAFVLLCAMSSAVYLMNDLADMATDRLHPVKRNRPLASGRLNPMVARVAFFVLALSSLAAGYALSPALAAVLLIYLALQLAYTFRLKHMVILDILAVAGGFVLRIAAGVAVISVERFSPWLYVFGGFLALFLVVGKRRHELVLLGEGAGRSPGHPERVQPRPDRPHAGHRRDQQPDRLQHLHLPGRRAARQPRHDADDSVCALWLFPLSLPGLHARRRGRTGGDSAP